MLDGFALKFEVFLPNQMLVVITLLRLFVLITKVHDLLTVDVVTKKL